MPTHVHFRFNKLTGVVEEFLIDDENQHLPEAEHDRIAVEVGRVVARNPLIREVLPGSTATTYSRTDTPAEEQTGRNTPAGDTTARREPQ